MTFAESNTIEAEFESWADRMIEWQNAFARTHNIPDSPGSFARAVVNEDRVSDGLEPVVHDLYEQVLRLGRRGHIKHHWPFAEVS